MHRFLLVSLLFLPSCAIAQSSGAVFSGGFRASQTNSPLSLVVEHKQLQTLFDGTHIERTTHEFFYRDSLGRTRTETEAGMVVGGGRQLHFVIVEDPVKGVRLAWQAGAPAPLQEYTRTEWTAPAQRLTRPENATQARPAQLPPRPRPQQADSRPKPEVTEQDLGNTTVQGETCHARLHKVVYPVDFSETTGRLPPRTKAARRWSLAGCSKKCTTIHEAAS